jgi:hypothetical protein
MWPFFQDPTKKRLFLYVLQIYNKNRKNKSGKYKKADSDM